MALGLVEGPGGFTWIMMPFCLPFSCCLLIIRAIKKLPDFIWEVTAAHLPRDREYQGFVQPTAFGFQPELVR